MWLLLLWACRVVEPPKPPRRAPKKPPVAVAIEEPKNQQDIGKFPITDELGLPIEASVSPNVWEPGESTILRRFLPGAGRLRRSLLPVNDGLQRALYARIVRAEGAAVDEDLDQLRYLRTPLPEGVQETLIVERVPVPTEKVLLLRRQRGALVPPPYAALASPGALPGRSGERDLELREPTPVEVLFVGGPSPGNEAQVDLAGRRLRLPRERVFVLPTHAMLLNPAPDDAGDTTLPVVVTAVQEGVATVVTEGGKRSLPLASLSLVRMTGSELLGDLPGESWLWVSEDRPEGRRIYLEQPVTLRGLQLPAGMVLELSAEGTIEAIGVEEAQLLGERRIGLPTVALQSEFRTPCRMGDTVEFRLQLERMGSRSLTLRVDCMHGQICCVLIRQVLVSTSLAHDGAIEIPQDVRDGVAHWQSSTGDSK